MADAGVVTRPGSLFGWDPLRSFVGLANTGAFAAHLTAFITLRQLVLGRRLAVRLDDGELAMTIVEADSRVGKRGLAVGQLNDVRLVAHQVRWNEHRFGGGTAILHNVHVLPSVPPVLVGAPGELSLDLPTPALDELFRWAAPRLAGEVGPDGVARLRFANHPAQALGLARPHARIPGATSAAAARSAAHGRRVRRRRHAAHGHRPRVADGAPPDPAGGHDCAAERGGAAVEPDLAEQTQLIVYYICVRG